MNRDTLKTIWQMGWKITLGCAIFALGFDLFLEPNNLNVGGMSGLAMVARELLGFGSIGILTMAPGGFFVYGCMIALVNKITKGRAIKKKEFGCEGCPGCGQGACGKEGAAK